MNSLISGKNAGRNATSGGYLVIERGRLLPGMEVVFLVAFVL